MSTDSSSSLPAGTPQASDSLSAKSSIPLNPSGRYGASVSSSSLSSGIEDTSLEILAAERARMRGFRDR